MHLCSSGLLCSCSSLLYLLLGLLDLVFHARSQPHSIHLELPTEHEGPSVLLYGCLLQGCCTIAEPDLNSAGSLAAPALPMHGSGQAFPQAMICSSSRRLLGGLSRSDSNNRVGVVACKA